MDKRTIIGFLAILLILFLWPQWNKLFYRKVEPPPNEKVQKQAEPLDTALQPQNQPEVIAPAATDIEKQPVVTALPGQPERLVTVENEDVIAVLSSYGGLRGHL